jgi:hypothetical protein
VFTIAKIKIKTGEVNEGKKEGRHCIERNEGIYRIKEKTMDPPT